MGSKSIWVCADHPPMGGLCCEAGCEYVPASRVSRLREAAKRGLDEMTSIVGDDDCGCNKTPPLCVFCALRAALAEFEEGV